MPLHSTLNPEQPFNQSHPNYHNCDYAYPMWIDNHFPLNVNAAKDNTRLLLFQKRQSTHYTKTKTNKFRYTHI